jgi:hypothetical protein
MATTARPKADPGAGPARLNHVELVLVARDVDRACWRDVRIVERGSDGDLGDAVTVEVTEGRECGAESCLRDQAILCKQSRCDQRRGGRQVEPEMAERDGRGSSTAVGGKHAESDRIAGLDRKREIEFVLRHEVVHRVWHAVHEVDRPIPLCATEVRRDVAQVRVDHAVVRRDTDEGREALGRSRTGHHVGRHDDHLVRRQ